MHNFAAELDGLQLNLGVSEESGALMALMSRTATKKNNSQKVPAGYSTAQVLVLTWLTGQDWAGQLLAAGSLQLPLLARLSDRPTAPGKPWQANSIINTDTLYAETSSCMKGQQQLKMLLEHNQNSMETFMAQHRSATLRLCGEEPHKVQRV